MSRIILPPVLRLATAALAGVFAFANVMSAQPGVPLDAQSSALSSDVVLAWNQIMLDANSLDSRNPHPDQPGPAFTSRAFAIVAAAMYDANNAISGGFEPYLTNPPGFAAANKQAAITTAAFQTLSALYPTQRARFTALFNSWLDSIPAGAAREEGRDLGNLVASAILVARTNDGSEDPMPFTPNPAPGHHQPDPTNPNQGFYGSLWGQVKPFVMKSVLDFTVPPPPALNSPEYAAAYNDVHTLGGEAPNTLRTPEQTIISIFWAYDGTPGLGKPPRLYNQIVRVIAQQRHNTVDQNARLFALINLAQADAAIAAWNAKYTYDFWRPIVGIRRGGEDHNPLTVADPSWTPLGAPFSNGPIGAHNFTPNFPSYVSGHATFGGAAFRVVANFYGTDNIAFDFVSDEFNGVTRDQNGKVRPRLVRHFDSLSDATIENARSRIYLGIHWQFDADFGIGLGREIADFVTANALRVDRN